MNWRAKAALIAITVAAGLLGAAPPRVIAVDVDGIVHPVTVEVVSRALDQARNEGAAAVLIRLNTPGGLMDAMRATIERMFASRVPVIAYVTPSGGRAASAGFFLLQAADVAAMSPGTNTGAAHPVILGREMDAVMKQKVEQDAAAMLRSIVARRGRNSELAEKAVLESRSFTDQEAMKERLIDLVARDEADLLRQLEGRPVKRFDGSTQPLHVAGASVVVYEPRLREKILKAVSDPNIALVLLVLGALGIYVEFTAPGLIVPGVLGAIMALVGLSAIAILPINWLGVALLLLALALFLIETQVPSHGVLGVGGAVAMVLGALLLIDSPLPEMRIRLATAISLALPFALITMMLVSLVVRARRNKVTTGAEGMIGEIGTALTALDPSGTIFVHGEYWNALATRPVAEGQKVRVTDIHQLKLTVEPVQDRPEVDRGV
ncbi:MAG TPA: nodulation protein NfeD [Bryobacteraceae bacterium]|nr:nodulation protein NfeD [Bryobacteraceae bacterium]